VPKNTAKSDLGRIQVSDEAIAEIAATAATKVAGVAGLGSGGRIESLAQVLGLESGSRGVAVETLGASVALRLSLLVEFGSEIGDVGLQVQEAVRESVEEMTGLEVRAVDVLVQGVRTRGR
jgi:uncharacterized alkaline shock family protein YloU